MVKALLIPGRVGLEITHAVLCFVSILGSSCPLLVQLGVYAHGSLGRLEPPTGSQLWEGGVTSAGGDPAQPLALSGL